MKNVICYKIILLFLTSVLHIGQLLKLPFLSQVLQVAICLQSTYQMFGMFSKHTQHLSSFMDCFGVVVGCIIGCGNVRRYFPHIFRGRHISL